MQYNPEIVLLADACYEMYELEELENTEFILGELSYVQEQLSISEIETAINLARCWKELDSADGSIVH
jgi:hypothetical protein